MDPAHSNQAQGLSLADRAKLAWSTWVEGQAETDLDGPAAPRHQKHLIN